MKSPSQTNAIDFDSAKLQRLGFGQQPPLLERPDSLAQLRQTLGLQLQTSLEPQRILGLFFREIQRLVPLDALNYEHQPSDLRLQLGTRGHHSISYSLSHEGEQLGELVFRRNQRFSEQEQGNLESLLSALLFPMRNALLYRAATQSALRDPLTDTGNRIAMDQTLEREIEMSRRHSQPLSLLMLDIDHFKQINDTYGHAEGDALLRELGQLLKSHVRAEDIACRYGGEEFIMIMPDASLEAVQQRAEYLRQAVKKMRLQQVQNQGQTPEGITLSLGVAVYPQHGRTKDAVLHAADAALYLAKQAGRDRVVVAESA